MQITFAIIAALTLVGGIAAMTMRKLVHCALCLAVTFGGLAVLYLQLGAQFAGFAQILVYVGAVAILVVFAILLTRSGETLKQQAVASKEWIGGAVVAVAVFCVLTKVILSSSATHRDLPAAPSATVKEIGYELMTHYVLPLEVAGLLLTAATIGAVIIALHDKRSKDPARPASTSGDSINAGGRS